MRRGWGRGAGASSLRIELQTADRLQGGEIVLGEVPQHCSGHALVIMPEHVSDPGDVAPGNMRMPFLQFRRQMSAGFGDDLHTALNQPPLLPGGSKFLSRHNAQNFLDPLDPTMLPLDVATLALQLNPTATWLSYAPGSLSVDAQEAITAAAMPEAAVRVVGMGASPANLAALQDGTAAAFTGYPIPLVGWRVIDQFARILGGEEPIVAMLPLQLLTAESVSSAALDADGNFIAVADYVDQFKALWGVK